MKLNSAIGAWRLMTAALVGCALYLPCAAADLLVWSAGAARPPLEALVLEFQKMSRKTLEVEYAPVGVLLRRLAEGGRPDVLVVSAEAVGEVERKSWTVAGSALALGSVGVGVAVKEGAPLPDISTPDALRKALLEARSITYMDPQKGTSGKHFAGVLDQLGITQQVKAKTTLGDIGFVVEPVARGDIELGVQQITEILPVKGVRLVGPLPASLQKITTYSIMIGAQAKDPPVAQALIGFLTSARAAAAFREKGFSVP